MAQGEVLVRLSFDACRSSVRDPVEVDMMIRIMRMRFEMEYANVVVIDVPANKQ